MNNVCEYIEEWLHTLLIAKIEKDRKAFSIQGISTYTFAEETSMKQIGRCHQPHPTCMSSTPSH